jgi:putative glutamine amidotransferase
VPVAVGICAAVERARWGVWDQTIALAPLGYAKAVQRAGGIAFLLPPDARAEAAEEILEHVDALLLAGGADLDPGTYGAERHPETNNTRPERDTFEVAMTRRALDRGIPVLGVCRGMHLLNVALGGTLVQHLPDVLGHNEHRHTPGTFSDHEVRLQPGSLAARAIGAERTQVRSHHHQGLDALGEGVVPTGWSEPDEIVEAIELEGRPYALGVLWHPEEDERSRVIGSLVAAAAENAEAPV